MLTVCIVTLPDPRKRTARAAGSPASHASSHTVQDTRTARRSPGLRR